MKLMNKSWRYYLRIIHRDLGYLMVGFCLIYGLSGMLLNHMNGKDPAFKTVEASLNWEAGLNVEEITKKWQNESNDIAELKRAMPMDSTFTRLLLKGGIGVYNSKTGLLDYEIHQKRPFVFWINRLHYNRIGHWSWVADFFAISLIFFAVSGLFILKGKTGLAGRGKWFVAIGILIPILYILFE